MISVQAEIEAGYPFMAGVDGEGQSAPGACARFEAL